jgi:hypothetical protein
MKTTLAFILAASLAACGGADPKPPVTPEPEPVADTTPVPDTTDSQPAPPAEPEPPPFALVLGEATVFEGSGKAEKPVWKLHADGTTESSGTLTKKKKTTTVWNPGATVKADGTIEAKGVAVAKLSADAITDLETNQPIPLTISGNTISVQTEAGATVTLTLADDGQFTIAGGPKDGKSWRIEAADPAVARTAFLVVGISMLAPPKLSPAPTK